MHFSLESWQLLDDFIKRQKAEYRVEKNSLRDYFAHNIGKEHHFGHNFGKKDITLVKGHYLGIAGHSIAVQASNVTIAFSQVKSNVS